MKVNFYFSLYKYIVWLEISTRKYASGYEKLKIKKKVEKLIESQKGSLNKFVISNKHINNNLGEKLINEQEIHQKELEDNVVILYPKNWEEWFLNKNIIFN